MNEQEKCPKCGKRGCGTIVDGLCVWCWRDKWEAENADLRRQLAEARAKALDEAASALEQMSMLDITTGREHPSDIIRRMADEAEAE